MCGAILPLPQYAFMASCLVKNRDNFTIIRLLVKSDCPSLSHKALNALLSFVTRFFCEIVFSAVEVMKKTSIMADSRRGTKSCHFINYTAI
jgi:hypothetical protein